MSDFPNLRARIGWSIVECATRLNVSRRTAQVWEYGVNSRGNPAAPPDDTIAYLARVAKAVEGVRRS
jgi:DNA-binding transcriptional regulator YiaG